MRRLFFRKGLPLEGPAPGLETVRAEDRWRREENRSAYMTYASKRLEKARFAGRFKLSLRRAYDRFLRLRGNPHEIALGFALGLFVGMSPFMGFQTAIAVFWAAICKANKISAAAGVWISNPVTAPVVYGFTFFVGSRFFASHQHFALPADPGYTTLVHLLQNAPRIIWILALGGIISGIPIALLGYFFSYSAIVNYRTKIKSKITEKKQQLAKKNLRRRPKKRRRHR